MMFSLFQLSPITYVAFGVLGYVIYLYIRQRTEYSRYLASQSGTQEVQPTFQSQRPFGSLGGQTPTFSAQELEQRKPAKEIDTTSLKPRSLQPEFSGHQGAPSSFASKQQAYESTEKMFGGGFKKSVQYEPTAKTAEPSSSTFAQAGRSQPSSSFYPPSEPSSRTFQQDLLHQLVAPQMETRIQQEPNVRRSSINEMKEEGFIAPRKQSIGEQQSVPVDKYGSEFELDREYKVFSQEFKQKEGKVFHDAKKLESPIRFGRGSGHSHFDRASHSPDSPFKFFEGKGEKDSQKRLKTEEQGKKSTGDVKEEPRGRGRERESAPSDLAKPSKITSKTDKRQKQIFMDVGSDDDEMLIEKERKQGVLHKRSAAESGSIDELEKQSLRGKYFKDNNNQGKYQTHEDRRKTSIDQGSLSPSRINESQGSSKRRSVADISYLSEYGANTSMKRYIEKKAGQVFTEKPERHSVAPSLTQKYVNPLVPVKDTARHSFPQSQEPKKLEVPKPSFTSLIQPSQKGLGQTASPGLTAQKRPPPGGFLLTNEPKSPSRDLLAKKPEKKEIEEEKPIVSVPEKKIGGGASLFTQSENKTGGGGGSMFANKEKEKIVEEKSSLVDIVPKTETKVVETVSITSLLTSNLNKPIESTFLLQQKSVEIKNEQPLLKASEPVKSQKQMVEELAKETNAVLAEKFDIFKTVRPGTAFPGKPEDNKPAIEENGKSQNKDEKSAADQTEFQKKKTLFFGGSVPEAKDKKPEEASKPEKEQEIKTEVKSLFGGLKSGDSLFATTQSPLVKRDQEEASNFSKGGLFGDSKISDGVKNPQESGKGTTGFFKNTAPAESKTENGSSSPKKPAFNGGGGGLFANVPKIEGSSSLFGGAKSTDESKPSGGGLFANSNQTPAIGSGGLFGNSNQTPASSSGGLFASLPKAGGGGLFSNKS